MSVTKTAIPKKNSLLIYILIFTGAAFGTFSFLAIFSSSNSNTQEPGGPILVEIVKKVKSLKGENEKKMEKITDLHTNCSFPYMYLAYEDARNNQGQICKNIFDTDTTYRIQEGGSVNCYKGKFVLLKSDPKTLSKGICVLAKTNLESVAHNAIAYVGGQLQKPVDLECKNGYSKVTIKEAYDFLELKQCDGGQSFVNPYEGYRVGVEGVIIGEIQNGKMVCVVHEKYGERVGGAFCIKRDILDIIIFSVNEDVCGRENRLYTVDEAVRLLLEDPKFCLELENDDIVRLAGGAFMERSDDDCKIINHEEKVATMNLCRKK